MNSNKKNTLTKKILGIIRDIGICPWAATTKISHGFCSPFVGACKGEAIEGESIVKKKKKNLKEGRKND
jgi:hypothetical protein